MYSYEMICKVNLVSNWDEKQRF